MFFAYIYIFINVYMHSVVPPFQVHIHIHMFRTKNKTHKLYSKPVSPKPLQNQILLEGFAPEPLLGRVCELTLTAATATPAKCKQLCQPAGPAS